MKKFIYLILVMSFLQSCTFYKKKLTCCRSILKKERTYVLFIEGEVVFTKKLKLLKKQVYNLRHKASLEKVLSKYKEILDFVEKRYLQAMVLKKYYINLEKKCSGFDAISKYTYDISLDQILSNLKEERDGYKKAKLASLDLLKKQKKDRLKLQSLEKGCKGKDQKSNECLFFLKKLNSFCENYINFQDCRKDSYCFFKWHSYKKQKCYPRYYLRKNNEFLKTKIAKRFLKAILECRKGKSPKACYFLVLNAEKYCKNFNFKKNCSLQEVCRWGGDAEEKEECSAKDPNILRNGKF